MKLKDMLNEIESKDSLEKMRTQVEKLAGVYHTAEIVPRFTVKSLDILKSS